MTADDLAATSAYGQHGSLAAGDFVHEWPFHDHDHLQQILAILKNTSNPQVEYITRTMKRWAKDNRVAVN